MCVSMRTLCSTSCSTGALLVVGRMAGPETSMTVTTCKPTKIDILMDLLRRPGGATIAQMAQATGWQAHSVRGALSGALKKRLAVNLSSRRAEAGRIYWVSPQLEDKG